MDKNNSKKAVDKASIRKKGLVALLVGAGIAALGGIVSYASYNNARPGETYTVYTGIIVIGIIYAGKGLFDLVFPGGFKKSSEADAPAVVDKSDADAPAVADKSKAKKADK